MPIQLDRNKLSGPLCAVLIYSELSRLSLALTPRKAKSREKTGRVQTFRQLHLLVSPEVMMMLDDVDVDAGALHGDACDVDGLS